MSLTKRIFFFLRCKINAVLDLFENPVQMARQAVLDCNQQVCSFSEELVEVRTNEELLRQELADNETAVSTWKEKATLAIKANREDLAREAMKRQIDAEQAVITLKKSLDSLGSKITQLTEKLDRLKADMQQAQLQAKLLSSRSSAAVAEQNANRLLATSIGTPNSAFEKADRLVRKQEATAIAVEKVYGKDPESIEAQLATLQISDGSTSVDTRLAELRLEIRQQE